MNYSNPKVFIVEDDIFYSEMLAHKLKVSGFENAQVFNSGETFEQHLYQMPDIVLLDYHLGDANGVELLKKIKAFNPNIQVILLSAQEQMRIAVNSLRYGAFDYLEKNEQSFEKLIHLIGRICLLNEDVTIHIQRSKYIKQVAAAASILLAGLFLLSMI